MNEPIYQPGVVAPVPAYVLMDLMAQAPVVGYVPRPADRFMGIEQTEITIEDVLATDNEGAHGSYTGSSRNSQGMW